jgi:hypothetical protein
MNRLPPDTGSRRAGAATWLQLKLPRLDRFVPVASTAARIFLGGTPGGRHLVGHVEAKIEQLMRRDLGSADAGIAVEITLRYDPPRFTVAVGELEVSWEIESG